MLDIIHNNRVQNLKKMYIFWVKCKLPTLIPEDVNIINKQNTTERDAKMIKDLP